MLNIDEISVDGNYSLKDYLEIKRLNDVITANKLGIAHLSHNAVITSASSTSEAPNQLHTDFSDWTVASNRHYGQQEDILNGDGVFIPAGFNILVYTADLLLRNGFYDTSVAFRRIRFAMHAIDTYTEAVATMSGIFTKGYRMDVPIYQADTLNMLFCYRSEHPCKIELYRGLPYLETASYNNIQTEYNNLYIINFDQNAY